MEKVYFCSLNKLMAQDCVSVGLCMNNFVPDIDEEINPHTITLEINTNKNALSNAFIENYYAFVCLYVLKL